jgi:hypothetical protein
MLGSHVAFAIGMGFVSGEGGGGEVQEPIRVMLLSYEAG